MDKTALFESFVKVYEDLRKESSREKNKLNQRKYRETHREENNAYLLSRNKAYYQANKERLNKQRLINYHKKKERERLEESLGESEKIDS
jgi:hypothetical protein